MRFLILLCVLLLRVSAEDEADSFYKKLGVAKGTCFNYLVILF